MMHARNHIITTVKWY